MIPRFSGRSARISHPASARTSDTSIFRAVRHQPSEEDARPYVQREIPIRGSDDADVELPLAIFTDSAHLVFLERA
jgi:hypothetical protein